MRIERERIQEVSDAIKNIIGVRGCIDALECPGPNLDGDCVEISFNSQNGEGTFYIPVGGSDVGVLYEALYEIECSMRRDLSDSDGIDFI
jgi:hypothetical protein